MKKAIALAVLCVFTAANPVAARTPLINLSGGPLADTLYVAFRVSKADRYRVTIDASPVQTSSLTDTCWMGVAVSERGQKLATTNIRTIELPATTTTYWGLKTGRHQLTIWQASPCGSWSISVVRDPRSP